ncbi:hypothetical protein [Alkalihalobacterium bogoriense]|uniref:hypothetical protein n=1 Tax=Alkalihalobacterium bogoriense TaxID=246272 RepID=UPI00047AB8C1|nr:hypothetical protein [Alkalihalobacterium bogoriense]
MSDIEKYSDRTFEEHKQVNEYGEDFWYARDLAQILQTVCVNSGYNPEDHFSYMGKMVQLGSGATREIEEWELLRYACYFIVQTRKQELQEQFETHTRKIQC